MSNPPKAPIAEESRHLRRWFLRFAAFFGFWAVVILGFTAQLVFSAEFAWSRAARVAVFDWFPWVVLSPVAIWVARQFPLERGRLRWSAPVHAVACVVLIILGGFISSQILPRPGPPQESRRAGAPPDLARPPQPGGTGGAGGGGLPPAASGEEPGPRPLRRNRALPENEPGGRAPPVRPGRGFWAVAFWNRSRFNLPVYWVIVSVVHAFSYYQRAQERDRRALELAASLSRAKLQALRLQLQPHFLFNTLNAIATLVHRDADKADEMIVNLGELLRLSLEVSEQEVPLQRELELVDRYLEIEKVRLGDRLKVNKALDPAALDALVPALMLQTLVENAVRHGIEPRAAGGSVTLRARCAGDLLELEVLDDGVGLRAAGRARSRVGIGLANTESRLAELYGGGGRLVLHEAENGGVRVGISLPFRRASLPEAGRGGAAT